MRQLKYSKEEKKGSGYREAFMIIFLREINLLGKETEYQITSQFVKI